MWCCINFETRGAIEDQEDDEKDEEKVEEHEELF